MIQLHRVQVPVRETTRLQEWKYTSVTCNYCDRSSTYMLRQPIFLVYISSCVYH